MAVQLEQLDHSFNTLDLTRDQLQALAVDILTANDIESVLNTDHSSLASFVQAVADKYNDVPFHNFAHAISVMHMTHLYSKQVHATAVPDTFQAIPCVHTYTSTAASHSSVSRSRFGCSRWIIFLLSCQHFVTTWITEALPTPTTSTPRTSWLFDASGDVPVLQCCLSYRPVS